MPDTLACRLCGANAEQVQAGELLGQLVQYFACNHCGYLQTEEPTWLEAAYAEPINRSDTGILSRNALNSRITLATLAVTGALQHRVLDYAGGYGVLVRLLRDAGVDAYWRDPYTENLFARGYEAPEVMAPDSTVITAFEVLEHLVNPMDDIRAMAERADVLLCSTTLLPGPPPVADDWWYLGREHGQHIGFYTEASLGHVAKELGMHLASNGRDYHLFTRKPVNAGLWRAAIRLNRLTGPLAARRLPGRMWDDHHEQTAQERGE